MALLAKPVPNPSDPISGRFWREAAQKRVSFQKCAVCGYLRWPPAAICPECWSPDATWTPVNADGEVWAFGVYERAFSPAFEDDIPYVVALVQLEAGPRMISNIVDAEPASITVGMQVTAAFEPFSDEAALVKFRPIEELR